PAYVLFLACRFNLLLHAFLWLALATTDFSLSPKFYDKVCPQALPAIKKVVEAAVHREPRMGASLLRLHFHDCFVNVHVGLGRRDSIIASRALAEIIYNATNSDLTFVKERRVIGPRIGGNTNLAPSDPTTARFDTTHL
ncbi:hypothetical protein Gohar_011637, partial [Gossypium harknessii]|nr:hypothetical protein [Gossypium harknessii]